VQKSSSTYVDWRADGVCVLKSIVDNARSINLKDAMCRWDFRRVADDEFIVDFETDSPFVTGRPMRFKIINQNRIHNINEKYDALRMVCPAEEIEILRKNVVTSQQRADAEPGNIELLRELTVAYERLGDALTNARNAEAVDIYRKMLDAFQQLAERVPETAEWQGGLAASHAKIANAFVVLQKAEPALEALINASTIRRKLAEAAPDNAEMQRELATSYENIADLLRAFSVRARALAFYQASLAVREKLTARPQSDTRFQSELVLTLYKMSLVSDPPGAKAALTRALSILDVLSQEHKLTQEQLIWPTQIRAALAKLQ